jgi:hypothetical protein
MSVGSVSVVLGFLLAVFCAASLLTLRVSADAARWSRFRARLLEQVRGLRLHEMLRYRGIDLRRYLYGERVLDIKTNIANCRRCQNLEECDRVLGDDSHSARDFSFCPNCEYLARIATEAPQGTQAPAQT